MFNQNLIVMYAKLKQTTGIALLCLIVLNGNAQLKIHNSTGNVGIDATNPVSRLSIGSDGTTYAKASIYNSNTGSSQRALNVTQAIPTSGTWGYGLVTSVASGTTDKRVVGLYASGLRGSSAGNSGRSFGVYGKAGYATSGWNYGVFGYIEGSRNGAAIFGAIPGKYEVNVNGMWAGYFRGNVKMENDLTVVGVFHNSDMALKKNVKQLEKGQVEKLKKLSGIKYNLKHQSELSEIMTQMADTGSVDMQFSSKTDEKYQKAYVGLSAQEVQKLYPELVKTEQDGYLSVNYIGLIPVLLEAIKEQQAEIEALKNIVYKKKK